MATGDLLSCIGSYRRWPGIFGGWFGFVVGGVFIVVCCSWFRKRDDEAHATPLRRNFRATDRRGEIAQPDQAIR